MSGWQYSFVLFLIVGPVGLLHAEISQVQPGNIKIIVIGAGAAGLSATQTLLERNFDVKILEARDEIGGRIQSKSITNGWIDLGASVVVESGELPSQLRQLGFMESVPSQNLLYFSDVWGQLSEKDQISATELGDLFNQLVEVMMNVSETEAKEVSVGVFLEGYYHHLITSEKSEEHKEQWQNERHKKLSSALFDFIVRVYRNQLSADSLHDVAIKTYNMMNMQNTIISLLNVPFTRVTDMLAAKIPVENILLNKEVTEIKFSPEDSKESNGTPIEVTTADGSTYPAHHVIFTASLGVLKENLLTLFTPNLSQEQQKAISSLEIGVGEKVFLEYDSPFWEELFPNITNLCFLWEENQQGDAERRYWNAPWYRAVDAANLCDSAENVLELLVSGKAAETVIHLSEQEIKDDITTFFRKLMHNDAIPTPARASTTAWSSNRFFRGSKSYISQKSVKQDVKIWEAFEPTWKYAQNDFTVPGLLFAGEATHPRFFSTVQGAIESGKREADRLARTLIDDREEMQKLISKMNLRGKKFGSKKSAKERELSQDKKLKLNDGENEILHDEM